MVEATHSEPDSELISAEQVGAILNPARPLTAASARKEMTRAGIREVRGYPADQVHAYAAARPGRGRPGHLPKEHNMNVLTRLTTDELDLLAKISEGKLTLTNNELGWSDSTDVTGDERELLRHLWKDMFISLPGSAESGQVKLNDRGTRVLKELHVFGIPQVHEE